jgi:pyruvate/2-oxoglutarate dehydrogenase complex dihydrolipoamide acyltransferase (E2) component
VTESAFASPRAAALAAELGIDAESIEGSGRHGKITAADLHHLRQATGPAEPAGLGAAGQALWRSILGDLPASWELDGRELALLERACRQADDLGRLEAVLAEQGSMAVGSAGQPVVHPAIAEARQARLAIARLLGQIELPGEEEEPESEATRRARHAAKVRWRKRDEIAERRQRIAERRANGAT